MSPVEFAAWLLLGMLSFWLLGGIVARVSGLLLVLTGAANLALDPGVGAALLIVLGTVTWLAGHWHYALRHHSYNSPLARHVFCRWAPEWLDPTRNWATPVTSVTGDPEHDERRDGR